MKKLPRTITQEEFEKLFSETIKLKNKSKKRKSRINQYMIAMLLGFEAGLRISEIVGYKDKIKPLTKEQIQDSNIKILGKGQKERIVPRPRRLNQKSIDELPLKVNRRSLQKFVEVMGLKVLNKKISFHTLRHGFGSHLAGMNRPLHEIQMLLGHSRLDTTGIYLHANPIKAIEGAREVF